MEKNGAPLELNEDYYASCVQSIGEFNFQPPPTPTWEWHFAGTTNMYFRPLNHPNLFHRLMQRLFLGIVWQRIKE